MGIRFACHACSKPLNIKQELAGKRGICPACRCRFRIPLQDSPTSRPVDSPKEEVVLAASSATANPTTAEILKTAPTATSASQTEPQDRVATGESHVDSVSAPGTANHAANDSEPEQFRVEESAVSSGAPSGSTQEEQEESSPATSPVSSLDLLSSDPNATWYVRPPSGGQYGPASGEMLREWIDEGRVSTTSLLWRDGWPQWREATEAFPELAESLPTSGDSFGYGDSGVSNKEIELESLVTDDDASASGDGRGSRSGLSGSGRIGAARRARTNRRTMAIAGLASVAILLLVVLIVVATR